jgi:hypothetical protein
MYHLTYQPADDAPSETRTATCADALTLLGRLANQLFRYGGSLELQGPDDQLILRISVAGQAPDFPLPWVDHLREAMARAHQLPSRAEIAAAERWLVEEWARRWQPEGRTPR